MSKKRILSGMRPTGKLHLGHLAGALSNWIRFQEEYDCFYEIADLHALTTDYQNPSGIRDNIREMLLDFLAFGLDPEKATIFIQSKVPEISEMHLLLSMITPLGWLERCPTYKEQLAQLADREITNYGFLGYPVLQTADIISFKAVRVPVGEDQVPHLELAREIVRRFNFLYGELFPEPEAILTVNPKLLGTDGRKMSKSYGNAILLADTPEEIRQKTATMFTDPLRPYRKDPGHPDACPVFGLLQMYRPEESAAVRPACTSAQLGCSDCKKKLTEILLEFLSPYQRKREELAREPGRLQEILDRGNRRAREIVNDVLAEAKTKMGLYGY
ncbi:MAG TPA: tryptophan--tRNA ligase [bacterium]|uniref:Tryptophan--tRNA ligase n=1 Tax=candidate division TA06 bacterium ADurb.Bin417 TaxID=1852828 RepID=A0A1V5MBL6_UNCT6|nr:MAG: Tryptophan--tRNA ligase [candidate division TA06 bacterium ADurb.Bin417]HNQ34751.1 tryptophan--tRNA ligase [bacterium]HNS47899.1 tryptophan--tRNA ligase [bacterium]